jgi:uncharacterized coiled-coil DUF342 family protein
VRGAKVAEKTLKRSTEDHRKDCVFLELKPEYDKIIEMQKIQNKEFSSFIEQTTTIVKKLDDHLHESTEKFKTKAEELSKSDKDSEQKFSEVLESIKKLSECYESSQNSIRDLRAHLDNGYQKKLRDAIEETQKKVSSESNKELIGELMGMLKTVVVGKMDIQMTTAKKFWQMLIQITAAGGLIYMIVQMVLKAQT